MTENSDHSSTVRNFQEAESKTRNIILEIERVQLIRKRCQSQPRFCSDCLTDSDFITAKEAALLFGTYPENLIQFIEANSGHYTKDADGAIFICVNSFLACVNSEVSGSKVRLLD